MASLMTKSFESPDETRRPDKTEVAVVHLDDKKVARFTMQPGWKWSECVKPVAGTDSCQSRHLGVAISGRLHVANADGTEGEIAVGDAYAIAPGHDAWVTSDEPFVAYEFEQSAAEHYAQGS